MSPLLRRSDADPFGRSRRAKPGSARGQARPGMPVKAIFSTAGSRPSRDAGLTALKDPTRRAGCSSTTRLAGLDLVRGFDGPIVDVGSGGGTPGIPLAASLPDREVTLLEAERRKADFLKRWTDELPNVHVVWGRAEEQPLETYGVAVAKALAQPPVAAEWCLPLVRRVAL